MNSWNKARNWSSSNKSSKAVWLRDNSRRTTTAFSFNRSSAFHRIIWRRQLIQLMKAKHTTGPSLPLERIRKSWCMAIICYITTTSTNTRVRLSSVCRSRANENLLFLPVQSMQSQLPDPPIAKISRSWIVHQLRTVRSIKLYSASDSRKISMISRRSSPHATSWSTKT